MIQQTLVNAANSGIPEVVEEIIEVFPGLVHHTNEMGQNIFHIAILNRCEDVFNLIYQFREEVRHLIVTKRDSNDKSCLDLILDLKKEQKLNLRASAAGAALQNCSGSRGFRTKETTTSGPVYTEAHEELVKEGEKLMKDAATSCTTIVALVTAVLFAVAITVPGGNDGNNGIPILFEDRGFIIFVILDAFGLFSSISYVVMFLSILTSRYSVIDFL
ncbi:ankyrin repeat-containing protein At5g02620-like [Cornus florida]|uniref:ankyrin repeat-containing protein At5g02620-like n=1 Tax=Cornus florida TaxID=4283 RepID=UPI00289DF727|nr:ankyrin repeat-containing protein At5g02620-like [Cornus florida]